MTDKEKLQKMDEIRRSYGISLENIKTITEEDVKQDALYVSSLSIAKDKAKYHNCLMEMIKILYAIMDMEGEA